MPPCSFSGDTWQRPSARARVRVAQIDLCAPFDTLPRNEKQGKASPCRQPGCPWPHPTHKDYTGCLAGACADSTTYNLPGEVLDMAAFLPKNRRLLIGFYLTGHGTLGSTTTLYVRVPSVIARFSLSISRPASLISLCCVSVHIPADWMHRCER